MVLKFEKFVQCTCKIEIEITENGYKRLWLLSPNESFWDFWYVRAYFFATETVHVETICAAISLRSNHKMTEPLSSHTVKRTLMTYVWPVHSQELQLDTLCWSYMHRDYGLYNLLTNFLLETFLSLNCFCQQVPALWILLFSSQLNTAKTL